MALGLVASELIESVQTIVDVFDPLALDALAPLCRQRDVALIARCSSTRPAERGDHPNHHLPRRRLPPPDTSTRPCRWSLPEQGRRALAFVPTSPSLAALALKFVAQSEGVTTALTSVRRPEHTAANIAAVDGPDLPDG